MPRSRAAWPEAHPRIAKGTLDSVRKVGYVAAQIRQTDRQADEQDA